MSADQSDEVTLSARLQAIADMTPSCDAFIDIGCDHGYIPIWLLKNNKCRSVIASDIGQGPLDTARRNARSCLTDSDRISFILSDGLDMIIPPERGYNVLSVTGMGGLLIEEILDKGYDKLSCFSSLILSPHTKQEELRRYLIGNGFIIKDERYVIDNDKLYVVMHVMPCKDAKKGYVTEEYTDKDYRFGLFINEALRNEAVRIYIMRRYKELCSILIENKGLPEDRREVLSMEAQSYREVLGI